MPITCLVAITMAILTRGAKAKQTAESRLHITGCSTGFAVLCPEIQAYCAGRHDRDGQPRDSLSSRNQILDLLETKGCHAADRRPRFCPESTAPNCYLLLPTFRKVTMISRLENQQTLTLAGALSARVLAYRRLTERQNN